MRILRQLNTSNENRGIIVIGTLRTATTPLRLVILAALAVVLSASAVWLTPATRASATPICTDFGAFVAATDGAVVFVPSTSSFDSGCFLAQGDNSDAVWALQMALKYCYGQNIATDSDFGPRPRAALVNVQNRLHIKADGGYGSQTRHAMSFVRADQPTSGNCHSFGF